jgi:hypothetical protein
MFGWEQIVWDEDDNGLVIAVKTAGMVLAGLVGYALLLAALGAL